MKDMGLPLEKHDAHYTYGDYRMWPDGERWELIDGVAYDMSPAPNYDHQTVAGNLFLLLGNFLKGKPCRLFIAPADVLLNTDPGRDEDESDTVVQPDLFVVCDPGKLTLKYCLGAPDLVIEILSPRTSRKDQSVKFSLYERHGVREYWIVDPYSKSVQVYALNEAGVYGPMKLYESGGRHELRLTSSLLEGFEAELSEIFS